MVESRTQMIDYSGSNFDFAAKALRASHRAETVYSPLSVDDTRRRTGNMVHLGMRLQHGRWVG